jgi:hypothetical protein
MQMRRWRLKTQLGVGFGIVLAFACIVGAAGLLSLGKTVYASGIHRQINQIQALFGSAKEQTDLFILNSHDSGRALWTTWSSAGNLSPQRPY